MKKTSKMKMTWKIKTTSKNEDNLQNEDNLRNEDNLKYEYDLKNVDNLKIPPSHKKEYYRKLFWWPLPLKATAQLMLNWKWISAGWI